MVIKRVGPLSCAKIVGVLYLILGFVFGGFFSLLSLVSGFAPDAAAPAGIRAVLGVSAILVFPILYACLGFVMTLIMAWLYNVLAGLVGGVELDLQ